jgi:hypothetical protein
LGFRPPLLCQMPPVYIYIYIYTYIYIYIKTYASRPSLVVAESLLTAKPRWALAPASDSGEGRCRRYRHMVCLCCDAGWCRERARCSGLVVLQESLQGERRTRCACDAQASKQQIHADWLAGRLAGWLAKAIVGYPVTLCLSISRQPTTPPVRACNLPCRNKLDDIT